MDQDRIERERITIVLAIFAGAFIIALVANLIGAK